MKNKSGHLYICPTPIGNLEDITLRCLKVLKEVDYIAAEDTRVTKKLLNHFEINTKLISYHKFSEKKQSEEIISKLKNGENIALVTDAGTPVVSDPGNEIVSQALENDIKVIPLPGPSAITCAISASGLVSEGFIFFGFLPKNDTKKAKLLEKLGENNLPIIFFESPNRIISTLNVIKENMGDIDITIARELTKLYEEIVSDKVTKILDHFTNKPPKGEFTIIISPFNTNKSKMSNSEIESLIIEKLNNNESVSSIAIELSGFLGLNKNKIYSQTLEIQKSLNK
ncbi:MAG: 16S rRNA (cytidine(1402)-2'-O)-methyltransferase [Vampirovibrionia bacterium]